MIRKCIYADCREPASRTLTHGDYQNGKLVSIPVCEQHYDLLFLAPNEVFDEFAAKAEAGAPR